MEADGIVSNDVTVKQEVTQLVQVKQETEIYIRLECPHQEDEWQIKTEEVIKSDYELDANDDGDDRSTAGYFSATPVSSSVSGTAQQFDQQSDERPYRQAGKRPAQRLEGARDQQPGRPGLRSYNAGVRATRTRQADPAQGRLAPVGKKPRVHETTPTNPPKEQADKRMCPVCKKCFTTVRHQNRHFRIHGRAITDVTLREPGGSERHRLTSDGRKETLPEVTATVRSKLPVKQRSKGCHLCTAKEQTARKTPGVAAAAGSCRLFDEITAAQPKARMVCKLCNKTFPTVVRQKSHFQMHYPVEALGRAGIESSPCSKAAKPTKGRKVTSPIFLRKAKVFECNICNKAFARSLTLKKHSLSHMVVKSRDNNSSDEKKDNFGRKIVKGNYSFKCNKCETTFSNSYRFRVHNSSRISSIKYTCNTCKKKFCTSSSLKNHLAVHSSVGAIYKCHQCNKIFKRKYSLSLHLSNRTCLPKHKCNICLQAFFTNSHLQIHASSHKVAIQHKCKLCHKEFQTCSDLKMHDSSHINICNKAFARSLTLKEHSLSHMVVKSRDNNSSDEKKDNFGRKIVEGNYSFKCNKCETTFSNSYRLKVHNSSRITLIKYTCNTCEKKFCTSSSLKNHLAVHSSATYKCHQCNMIFKRKYSLSLHLSNRTCLPKHKCNICLQAFFTNSHLQVHASSYKVAIQHKCKLCHKEFQTCSDLKMHASSHINIFKKASARSLTFKEHSLSHMVVKSRDNNSSDEKKDNFGRKIVEGNYCFKCNKCETTFSNSYRLKVHNSSRISSIKYTCNTCKKKFCTSSSLKNHSEVHSSVGATYKCHQCNKIFKRKYSLSLHLSNRTCLPKHKCNICLQAFFTNSHLQVHASSHKVAIQHKCKVCHKEFQTFSDLKMHASSHKVLNKLKCKICRKEFSSSSGFKIHAATHDLALKIYKCNICKKGFTRSYTLRIHQIKHDLYPKLRCGICNKEFSSRSSLRYHVLSHKGVKKPM